MRQLFVFLLLWVHLAYSAAQIFENAVPVSSKKLISDFFDASIQYPKDALQQNISGKVKIAFKISKDGIPYDLKPEKSIDPSLDKEAMRLVSKILWHPAKKNGTPCIDEQSLTITFNPKHYNRIVKERGYDSIDTYGHSQDISGKIFNFATLDMHPQPVLPQKFSLLQQYIQQQLKYPEAAAAAGITGTVRLDFVIETDGIVSNIRISNSVGGGCDNEAIRILQHLRWKPGIKEALAVRSHAFLDVTFQLEGHRQMTIPNRQSGGL